MKNKLRSPYYTDGEYRLERGSMWFLDNKLHREDGPAIERANGTKAWYLDGKECTQEQIDIIILAEFGREANE